MQLFAKRTRTPAKVGTKNATTPNSERSSFASDDPVQDLLKNKDPSEWNAKEKRMVKRYQDRKPNEGGGDDDKEKTPAKAAATKTPVKEETKAETETKTDDSKDKEDSDDDNDESESAGSDTAEKAEEKDSDDDEQGEGKKEEPDTPSNNPLDLESVLDPSILGALNSKQRRKLTRLLASDGTSAVAQVVQEAREITNGASQQQQPPKEEEEVSKIAAPVAKKETAVAGKSDREQLEDLLNTLNSKQRRKLLRRLEREGDSCMVEVRTEAEKLLNEPAEEAAKLAAAAASAGKKRKRRRGPADLSGLTPEERLRREEQRKMQQEAKAERAAGEDEKTPAGHKHALNSERRRANRRKPKWAPKQKLDKETTDQFDHNSSGFQHRKFAKTEA